jgi:hypothetical protein
VLLTQKILHCLSTSGQLTFFFRFVSLEQGVQFGWGEALENCSTRQADFSFRLGSTYQKRYHLGFTRSNPMGIERNPINVQLPLHHELVVSSGDYRGRTQASLAGLPYLVHERPANKGNFSPINIMISPVALSLPNSKFLTGSWASWRPDSYHPLLHCLSNSIVRYPPPI